MSPSEAEGLVAGSPTAARFLKRFGGAKEASSGNWRMCLWIEDADADAATRIPDIARRLESVRAFREASEAASTRDYASKPHRFVQRAHQPGSAIVIPRVSTKRRVYLPIDVVDDRTVISDASMAIYGAELWLFGLIASQMHLVWFRAVGGRFRTHPRYSSSLVYNTFSVPPLSDSDRKALRAAAASVLGAREHFPDRTLADLYDPDEMPGGLREAHRALDETVDRIYRKRPFESDEERLQLLFEMYEAAVREEEGAAADA